MKRPEDALQKSIVQYVRAAAPQLFIFSVPNAGRRSFAEASVLRSTGMVKGVPDLCIIAPQGRAYFIECKSAKGSLRPEQREIRDLFMRMAVPCICVQSVEEVRIALREWRLEAREANPQAAE